jgi:hypothetical protein
MTEASEADQPPLLRLWLGLKPYMAPALIFLAIVVSFLRYHEYHLLLPESLILMAAAAVLGVGSSLLARLRPTTLAPAFIALSLCVYVYYLPYINDRLILAVQGWIGPDADFGLALGLIGVAAFLTMWCFCVLLGRQLETVVIATFATIVLSTVILPTNVGGEPVEAGAIPTVSNDLPPLIHIILDEHIGLAGIPDVTGPSRAAAQSITTTYKDFKLYRRAYSRFAETKYALTALMNGDLAAEAAALVEGDLYRFGLLQNRWFDQLKAQGYAIRVYQSAWFDMCGASPAVDSCYTYPLFSPNPVQRTSLSTAQRLNVLAQKLAFGKPALQMGPLAATEALQQFTSDIARAPRGVAYIVHLLLPHFGYLYRSDCSLTDPGQWEKGETDHGYYAAAERDELYSRYFGQLVCTGKRMEAVFATLKKLGIYDDATIIVHGDHGSRIGERHYIWETPDTLSNQDLMDHFATLLAVKAPGVAPGLSEEPAVLQRVFAEQFLPDHDLPDPGTRDVLIRQGGSVFGSRDLVWPGYDGTDAAERQDVSELRR